MKKTICLLAAGTMAVLGVSCDKLVSKEAGGEKKAAPAMQMPVPVVKVGAVGEMDEINTRKYIGRIVPIENVEIKARVSGNINSIKFKEGDYVKAGDLLIEIEDTTYKAALLASQARLQQAEAELLNAEQKYNRQLDLANKNIATPSEMEDATKSLHLAQAVKAAAEASLIDAENNYSYTKIYSPISGKIGKATYTFGNYITPTSGTLAEIVQFAPVYVSFAMSEPDYMNMFGNPAELKSKGVVRLRTSDRTIFSELGKVTLLDNKVDADTGTIMMWATFENGAERLIPGGIVDVMISKKAEKKYPAIKVSALMFDKNGFYVYGLTPANNAVRRDIEVGDIAGDMQIVFKGLEIGETIVTDGTHKVMFPGMQVKAMYDDGRIVEPPAPAPAPASAPSAQTSAEDKTMAVVSDANKTTVPAGESSK